MGECTVKGEWESKSNGVGWGHIGLESMGIFDESNMFSIFKLIGVFYPLCT